MTDLLPSGEGEKNDDKEDDFIPTRDDYSWPRLRDVITSPELHTTLEDLLHGIYKPEVFGVFGIVPDKTFMLQGQPGTGKTLSVKALRNELNLRGVNATYAPYDIGTYGTAYINLGAVQLKKFFDHGRKLAHKGNTVLYFFDEADVLMSHRENHSRSHKEDEKLLTTLMSSLQDIKAYGEREYVFFATNFPEGIDGAAVRAGRIDRVILFPLPEFDERRRAYEHYVSVINKKAQYNVLSGVDCVRLSRASDGFNYADIAAVVEASVREEAYLVLRQKVENRMLELPVVTTEKVLPFVEQHKSSRSCVNKRKRVIGYA